MLQVLFDQDRTLKRASCKFALRIAVCILWSGAFLFLYAYKHLREEEALQFLPRLAVFANSYGPVKTQLAESAIH